MIEFDGIVRVRVVAMSLAILLTGPVAIWAWHHIA
jgi:hypothetical protein